MHGRTATGLFSTCRAMAGVPHSTVIPRQEERDIEGATVLVSKRYNV